jgi:hypothetical protein
MLTAHEREKLIAQWNHDRLVAEWRRQRSAAYAGAIQRAARALVAMIKRPLARVAGSAATQSPEDPRPGAAAV